MPGRSKRAAAAKRPNYAGETEEEDIDAEVDASGDEEEAHVKPKRQKKAAATKSKAGKAAKAKKKPAAAAKANEDDDEEADSPEKKLKSVVKKGKAPVDSLCPIAGSHHVFFDDDGIWDCMLNQTNIQNNNNKYYLIQLLADDATGKQFAVWMRWGRVGMNGQNSLVRCGGDLDHAKATYKKKFTDKTKNDWDERADFEKVAGKYDLVHMDYDGEDDDDGGKGDSAPAKDKGEKSKKAKKEEEKEEPKKIPESALHERLQALIRLICDVATMEQTVVEMEYDTKKAPLGKITNAQIKAGYSALKEVTDLINAGKVNGQDIINACNDFYTRIPHEFGMRRPPILRTIDQVKKKISLLEALGDIQVAMTIINSKDNLDMNPIDRQYKGLDCDLSHLDRWSGDFKLIEKYIQSTHAKTHNMYSMQVEDIFECSKDMEKERFKDKGNRMLLFHGSRLSNWTGILSQGLRIAPPEAPVTGYMFGKGVYFADMSSKSANYCWPSHTNNVGLLLLCEVAIGTPNEKLNADYNAADLPKGKHSTKGLGKVMPNPKNAKTLSDGTLVPLGPGVDSKVNNPAGYTLQYNEYIIYDLTQIKMRYLARIKFKY